MMTDPAQILAAPVVVPVFDFPTYLARQAAHEARAEALRPANKTALFEVLTAAGISHVTATFDGEGDNGQIESVEAWSGDVAAELPLTEISVTSIDWHSSEATTFTMTIKTAIEQMAYDFLSDTHGGWENNDGAFGEFCFDATARTIQLDYNERIMTHESYGHDF